MEKVVVFRDYQEEQAQDHNALQTYARQSNDHLVHDAVTASRRFSGFDVVKSSQTEITVAAGRVYDVDGAVFNRASTLVQSLTPYLAASSKRIVLLTGNGVVTDTDVTERDFLMNVETGATEPQSVAMTRSRDAVLSIFPGAESADPQRPAVPALQVAIAYILLDVTQVVSITMAEEFRVKSTENLDQRTNVLEDFKGQIGPRVQSLASDLAALANELRNKGNARAITQLFQDVADVKARLEIPTDASDYGADRFLNTAESDIADAAGQGYDCLVQEGLRFPAANMAQFEMDVFSANDPNKRIINGLMLPSFTDEKKLSVEEFHSEIGIAQYGFQTFDLKQMSMSRERLRYGSTFTVCTNSNWWQSGLYDPITNTFSRNGETFTVLDRDLALSHAMIRVQQIWIDSWQEPYWDYVATDHSILGAQIAQSFLVSNDMWLTTVGFYLTSKAANEAVFVTLCELTNGVPDLNKVILHQTIAHTSLVNGWVEVPVTPTFLGSGKRYAMVITSNANHKFGMASGQQYLAGTFFYSTDGQYFLGDLTKDMMFRLYGAKFTAPQVAVELEALSLDGGINSVDILAGMIVPQSCQLVFEVQPGGSGAWLPLATDMRTAFATTPPLARFRARFVGTRDMMPGLMLTGSVVTISRPKTAFKHVSTVLNLAGPSTSISVKYILEGYQETPHNFSVQLRHGTTNENPTVVEDKVLPDLPEIPNRLERTFHYTLGAGITSFRLIESGSSTSAANLFNGSERVYWSL